MTSPQFKLSLGCLGLLLLTACMISGCTVARIKTPTIEVTVADLRVSGSAIDLEGVLNDVGSISVNREQGSALQDAAPIVEQLNPAPQFDFRPSL